jgi:hypothetical protein
MTQHRRRSSILLVLSSLLLFATLNGIPQAQAAGLVHTVTLDPARVVVDTRDGEASVRVDDRAWFVLSDEGLPALPYRVVSFVLPQGELFDHVEFGPGESVLLADGTSVRLASPNVSDDGLTGNAAPLVAGGEGVYPPVHGKYLGTGYLHGRAVASIAVFPLRADAGRLLLTNSISVNVVTRTGQPEIEVVTRQRRVDGFNPRVARELASFVVNADEANRYIFDDVAVDKKRGGFQPTSFPSLEGSPVDYVIITTDALAADWQTLADWKTDKGVPTVIRTVEWIAANYRNGSDLQETIRNFVKDAYAKWGVTYVMLGGDVELIPARRGASFYLGDKFVPVDLYYGCLDGDWNADHDEYFGEGGSVDNTDLYGEVYIGRLPVHDGDDVSLLTSKIITYETTTDSGFSSSYLFLAEVLYPYIWKAGDPTTMNGAQFAENVKSAALTDPDLNVTRMYETDYLYPGSVHESRAAALTEINTGYNHINHIGHGFRFNMSVGDAAIVNGDADVLTNAPYYGNFYLLNCTAVAFTYYCLGEHLLMSPAGGAVTTVGASESAFPITSSLLMTEYYDLLFNQGVVNIGETFARSRLPRTAIASLADNSDLWTHYIYAILADPEMPLWTDALDPLAVTHLTDVNMGENLVTVSVNSGGPFAGALVCLTKGEDDYKYGYTNGAGQAAFDFRSESPGQIKVVVTASNHIRYEGTITVNGASSPYVSVNGLTVDDDNIDGTAGNGDGVIDAGETVDLWLEMINSGGSASGLVDVVIATPYPGVTIIDNAASVGLVTGGGTQLAADPVRMTFSATIPDETAVPFDLTIKENSVDTWVDEFSRVVHAPVLDLVSLRVDDSVLGNGDGVVDANEQFALYYIIKNFGTGTAYGLAATLADLDAGFVVMVGADGYLAVGPMAEAENVGGFILQEPDISSEHGLEITIFDGWGRAYVDTIELRPPAPPDSLTFDPSLGSDRLSMTWFHSPSPDVARYNVYKSLQSGGPYSRINLDPVDHAFFLAPNLQGSTRYYFVATAVDESGNESLQSNEFSGSTNPPQLPGWPISMKRETVSSPVIGDIDGDGDLEIVQGDDKVYAWHHDGVELIDADGNAQTWGVLSTEGDEFVSPIALAMIDGNPGHEILSASRATREVFVMNYQGVVLPEWPRTVENFIRAGLVAGDINNDGVVEIIAVDERGVIYVWNGDGSEYIDGDANPATQGVFFRMPGNSYLFSAPAVADIDNDGVNEIVAGSQGAMLYVLNEDGSAAPGFPVALDEPVCGSPAVGDIDGDGDLEIVVNQLYGMIRAFHHDGSSLWVHWFPNNITFGPSPALGDITGDGKLECFIPSADKNLYAIRYNGSIVPGWPVAYSTTTYTESSPIVADLNGDGSLDVVLGDESKLIKAWDVGGNMLDGFPLGTGDAMRAVPAVVDIDRDGDVDLIAAGWDTGVYVWDFPDAYVSSFDGWPSFHGNHHNDGLHGSRVPTGVGGVTFASEVRPGSGVALEWHVPASAGFAFDVQRAGVSGTGAEPGAFGAVAMGLAVGAGGELRHVDTGALAGETYVYRLTDAESGEEIHVTGSIYVPVMRGELSQNYPNPFNPLTRITYLVPDGGVLEVRLVVYDVRGARVRTLVDDRKAGGKYTVEWDGRNDQGQAVGSGVYFYRLVSTNFTQTRKMLLLK